MRELSNEWERKAARALCMAQWCDWDVDVPCTHGPLANAVGACVKCTEAVIRHVDGADPSLSGEAGPEVTTADPVVIWSGEHFAFWGPNRGGYFTDPCAAGRYSRVEAERIASDCGPEKRLEIRPAPACEHALTCQATTRVLRAAPAADAITPERARGCATAVHHG